MKSEAGIDTIWLLPMMQAASKPSSKSRIYFVTAKTSQGKALLQTDRMANLFMDVLRSFRLDARFKVHEFMVLRNCVQLLIGMNGDTAVEEALRNIKGRFASRAVLTFSIRGWIWDRDVTTVLVPNRAMFLKHKAAMEKEPVKAGLADSADQYPYCSAYLRKNKAADAKATGV
jgi:putative transposase